MINKEALIRTLKICSPYIVLMVILLFGWAIAPTFYVDEDRAEANQIIKKLMDENDSLKHLIEEIPAQQSMSNDSLKFEVDFKALRAFSIERIKGKGTVIGYYDKSEKVHEWTLFCSEKEHQKLAEQFRKELLTNQ